MAGKASKPYVPPVTAEGLKTEIKKIMAQQGEGKFVKMIESNKRYEAIFDVTATLSFVILNANKTTSNKKFDM